MMPEDRQFENQNLAGAVFQDCCLAQSTFENADMSECSFSNVRLERARFKNVNMAGVAIDDANIEGLTVLATTSRSSSELNWAAERKNELLSAAGAEGGRGYLIGPEPRVRLATSCIRPTPSKTPTT